MTLPYHQKRNFSPYRDDEPWAEYYDDIARRGQTAAAIAFAVHIAFFFMLQPSFRMPDIPQDPDVIPVQIIAFEQAAPEPAAEPEIVIPCLLYTSPSPRDRTRSRMPSSA